MDRIVYLKPKSAFRNPLRSDTLWGALCWAIRMVEGNKQLEKFIQQYEEKPPIVISSCFPYKQIGTDKIPYFPIPMRPKPPFKLIEKVSLQEGQKALRNKKKRKKITYLSKEVYESFLKGDNIDPDKIQDFIAQPPKIKTEAITHNTINRITNGSDKITGWKKVKVIDEYTGKHTGQEVYEAITTGQLFHIEENFLIDPTNLTQAQDNVGLYFLVKGDMKWIEGALRYLEDTGIGGDRGTGKGHFEISHEPFNLNVPQDGNAWTNLSLYHPTDTEINTIKGDTTNNYKLEVRQGTYGFMHTMTWKKPQIMFFKEGSVFSDKISRNSHSGFNPIVLPKGSKPQLDHDVYQYGTAFMVKMKI